MISDIFICAFGIIFIHSCFGEGMIFGKFGFDFEGRYPELSKPLFSCLTCMGFWWGSIYWALWVSGAYVPFVFGVGGLLAVISFYYE